MSELVLFSEFGLLVIVILAIVYRSDALASQALEQLEKFIDLLNLKDLEKPKKNNEKKESDPQDG